MFLPTPPIPFKYSLPGYSHELASLCLIFFLPCHLAGFICRHDSAHLCVTKAVSLQAAGGRVMVPKAGCRVQHQAWLQFIFSL